MPARAVPVNVTTINTAPKTRAIQQAYRLFGAGGMVARAVVQCVPSWACRLQRSPPQYPGMPGHVVLSAHLGGLEKSRNSGPLNHGHDECSERD